MHACQSPRISVPARKPLAACICALFALTAPPALSAPVPVTNCLDSGAGSLRAAVAAALSGDTVDMTSLPCSTITLASEIAVPQFKLTLQGPGAGKLVIDGNSSTRLLNFTGNDLYIYDLSIANGYVYSPYSLAAGGCINSIGSIFLNHSNVSGCAARTYSGTARGGGVYTGGLTLTNSTISSSTASCYAGGTAEGGGADIRLTINTISSTIRGNSATCRPGGTASSGGILLRGSGAITDSTISGNYSSGDFGGLSARPFSFFKSFSVRNSTISGNTAAGFVGGMSSSDQTTVANSTIAFNSAGAGSPSSGVYEAPGLHVDYSGAFQATVESSLIANNTYGVAGKENDFSLVGTALSDASVNNLIRQTTAALPATNIQTACPWLGPLRDNGGPTLTHVLLSRSPGIDDGSNSNGLPDDQRGSPYARLSGAAPDVGAYEVQQDDIVFDAGFDGCPAL